MHNVLKFIPKEKREKVDIEEKVKLEYYKLQQDFEGDIMLVAEDEASGELKHPEEFNANVKPVEERNPLEEVIQRINDRFPDEFNQQDRVIVETLHQKLTEEPDAKIVNMAKHNSQAMFEKSLFKDIFNDRVVDDTYYREVYSLIAADVYKTLGSKD